ncbi:hypothetical protein F0U44_12035 [Nocardioides humilatus]|uniref:CopG family transcriptional regulator n=1 Tax=Nocardioides humilatus TaxID=2607660 RepID=A0A5B1LFR1_9ACTN|nr:hypothetical protein [Nocardioides humilatus]KAA1419174.1 hypothetical protein F0U44_12035 [Nocardioides humilatus]
MGVVKRSVSLDERVAAQIEVAAREDGTSFSGWLSAAVEEQLLLRDGRRAMAEWEAEHPIPSEVRDWARAELDKAFGDRSEPT